MRWEAPNQLLWILRQRDEITWLLKFENNKKIANYTENLRKYFFREHQISYEVIEPLMCGYKKSPQAIF